MNTLINLLYRDGCNYKTGEDVIFAGAPTPELTARYEATLDGADAIVAEQVGLENPARNDELFDRRFPDEEDDHGWVEAGDIEPTDHDPTDPRTFEQFVIECETIAAGDGWDPMVCINAAGGWTDPEEAAAHRNGDINA
jgi:hypothetical protein